MMYQKAYTQFQYCIGKEQLALKKYSARDIRISFWMSCCEIYRFYYCSLKYCECDYFINHHKILLNAPKLKWSDTRDYKQGFINLLNSKLIVDLWSSFELLITLTSNKIVSEKQKQSYLDAKYNEVFRKLPENCVSEETRKQMGFLKQKDFTRTSINNKYESLFKIIDVKYNEFRDIKQDREFLDLFGRLRNGIHNNYIYFGTDKNYTFQDITITFQNNKIITFTPNNEDSVFNLATNLVEIADTIIECIEDKELIDDPSHDLII